jgi:hypothetical protein
VDDNSVTSEEKQDRRKLMPHLFKPGQSGNPAGRPPGSSSLKVFARDMLMEMPREEKLERLRKLSDEDFMGLWKMAEGNPHSTSDETVKHVIPVPILAITPKRVAITDAPENPPLENGVDKP